MTTWSNWSGLEQAVATRSEQPRSTAEVVAAVDDGSLDEQDVTLAASRVAELATTAAANRRPDATFDEDTQALDVLYTCLEAFCRAAAPLMPLVSEEIWRGLTGGRSVHLTDYPDAAPFFSGFDSEQDAEALVERMETVRRIASAGSSLRKGAKRRVRLPLRQLTVVVPDAAGLQGAFSDIVRDELNLKSVELLDASAVSAEDFGISQQLAVNARAAGPRLGKQVQVAIKGAKSGDWSVAEDGTVTAGGIALQEGEYTLETTVGSPDDGTSSQQERAVTVIPGGFLVLDTAVPADLAAEGTARDVVRAVQAARKDVGLEVSDRVRTAITGPGPVVEAVRAHQGLVAEETLTTELVLEDSGAADPRKDPADDATKLVQVTVSRA